MTNSHQGAVERLIAELAQMCVAARGDHEDDVARAYEAGERSDLWDPPEVCVNVTQVEAILTAYQARVKELEGALRSLTFAARTSGGTAGPDAGLMHACDDAEILLLPSPGGEGA